jgi:hypothetical protein
MNLSGAAGMHRFVWDMHYPPVPGAPRVLDANQAVRHNTPELSSAPWIMPGRYTVRLTVAGRTYTQPLTVIMDPRVHTPLAALQQQFDASMQAYRKAIAASAAVRQARALEKQIAARKPTAMLRAYRKRLEDLSGQPVSDRSAVFFHPGPPSFGSVGVALQRLMRRMQAADRAPTAADLDALAKLSAEYRVLRQRWAVLRRHDPLAH